MVMSTAQPAIPARPMRWRVLRPARSTTKSCWVGTGGRQHGSQPGGKPSSLHLPRRELGGPKLTETTVKAVFTTPEPMVA